MINRRGYLDSILKEFNFMRTLKLSVLVVLAFSILGSCMSIPASIIDAEAWMHKEPAFHSRQIYVSDWGGAWLPVIDARPDELQRLMLIDVKGDPVYEAFELQLFAVADEYRGVAIAARKDGRRDYYYQPGVPMTEDRRKGIAALLNNPGIREWQFDLTLEVVNQGLHAALDLIDIDGRRIVFTVRENKPDRRLSAILAPVSSGTDQPESFPLVYLDDFSMVLVRNTEVFLEIDGKPRKPVVFPLLVDGQRVFYSRYSSRVAIADLLPEVNRAIHPLPLEPGQEILAHGMTEYHFIWNGTHPELQAAYFPSAGSTIGLHFKPGFPDPSRLASGVSITGSFLVSVNDVSAVIGGKYEISNGDQQISWSLQPLNGWQPPGMSRVPWVSTFTYEATGKSTAEGFTMESNWFRSRAKP
jgi:hypothetical protein